MAKGGYQKRRIAEKKEAERRARQRAERRKKWTTIGAVVLVLALIGGVGGIAFLGGDDKGSLANDPTPTPSATDEPQTTAAFTEPCTATASAGQKTFEEPPCKIIEDGVDYTATFETSEGTIIVDLLEDEAPVTVNHFIFLARAGFYDGTKFHRVIPDFGGEGSDMVQGGDAVNGDGTGGPGYEFGDENIIPFDTGGALAMANSGPGTNGSQFFFLSGTVGHLNNPDPSANDGNHSVFGRVIKRLKVINTIADAGNDAVTLTKVTINEG